jgi:hypothetical protein
LVHGGVSGPLRLLAWPAGDVGRSIGRCGLVNRVRGSVCLCLLLTGPSGSTLTGLSGSLLFGVSGLRGVRPVRLGLGLIVCWRARRSVLVVSLGPCLSGSACGLLLLVRRVRGFVRGRLGGLSPGVGVGCQPHFLTQGPIGWSIWCLLTGLSGWCDKFSPVCWSGWSGWQGGLLVGVD